MKLTSVLALLLSFALGACACPTNDATPESIREPLVAFLVRHAEKAATGRDPQLTEQGGMRASELAQVLRSAGIERVHSSDTIRTRETARPTAQMVGAEVELYDPRDLTALVEALRLTGGRHLVVGHSNTTPALAELLGAEAGEPIDEKGEFDRIYIVTVDRPGEASSVILRYGTPFEVPAAR